jgi:hypothetical protein
MAPPPNLKLTYDHRWNEVESPIFDDHQNQIGTQLTLRGSSSMRDTLWLRKTERPDPNGITWTLLEVFHQSQLIMQLTNNPDSTDYANQFQGFSNPNSAYDNAKSDYFTF